MYAFSALASLELRRDGVPVQLAPLGALEAEFARQAGGDSYPFKPFSSKFVERALATGVDWVAKGAVTPAKDQGAHGYCGTFGRVAAAEGQFALSDSMHGLRNFSEEMLVDCVGWDKDQFAYFSVKGFMDTATYPYNTTGPDLDPPVPYNPCRFDASKVIAGTAHGAFTGSTGGAPSEEQLAAFVFRNGPTQTGINANVFGLREKGCEATGTCFITKAMCDDPSIKGKPIDHSVTLVGFGTDATHGDYWQVKNSWSTKFGNQGFIKVARGISCGHIDCCGNVFTMGDPASYYEEHQVEEDA
jgi:hypothetical protein